MGPTVARWDLLWPLDLAVAVMHYRHCTDNAYCGPMGPTVARWGLLWPFHISMHTVARWDLLWPFDFEAWELAGADLLHNK